MLVNVLVVVFVLLLMLQLNRAMQLAPLLGDSLFRVRGSSTLENSVRYSHDRNNLALTLLIPAVLVAVRYQLYRPSFLEGLSPNLYLPAAAGVFLAYILLRWFLYLWFKPRSRYDNYYVLAHQTGHTYFILLMALILVTVGLLTLLHAGDALFRMVIHIEIIFIYSLFIFRKTQILSLFCNPLRTFLYLCGLEFFPAALLVVSAAL